MKSDVIAQTSSAGDYEIFKALMESVNEAVFVIEPQALRFLEVNSRSAAQLGYSTAEMMSLTMDRIFPDCGGLLEEAMAACGKMATAKSKLLAKDGRAIEFTLIVLYVKHLANPALL